MKRRLFVIFSLVICLCIFTSCNKEKKCLKNGHEWLEATCEKPRTCSRCGATEGGLDEHDWQDLKVVLKPTCYEKGKKQIMCAVCGKLEEVEMATEHTWNKATCFAPKTCKLCGVTEGTHLEHQWGEATCKTGVICKLCKTVKDAPLPHDFVDGVCVRPDCKEKLYTAAKLVYEISEDSSSYIVVGIQNQSSMKVGIPLVAEEVVCKVTNKVVLDGEKCSCGDEKNHEKLQLPITKIGKGAFKDCTKLKEVQMQNNIIEIEDEAFLNCKNLTYIVLSNSVKKIGNSSFEDCTNVKGIYLSENLEEIGSNAFKGCQNISYISIPKSIKKIGSSFLDKNDLEIKYMGKIEDWLNISFESETANPSYYAKELYINDEKVTSIIIPNTINNLEIGQYQFVNFKDLTKVEIPSNVSIIGKGAFAGCVNIEEMILPFIGRNGFVSLENHTFGYIFGNSYYDGTIEVKQTYDTYEGDKTATYYIPAGLKKVTITDIYTGLLKYDSIIPKGAFENCRNLETVILPSAISYIGENAFKNCQNVDYIFLPSDVKDVYTNAFTGCNDLVVYVEGTKDVIANWDRNWNIGVCSTYYGVNDSTFIIKDGVHYVLVDDYVAVARYYGDKESITIPNDIQFNNSDTVYPVTSIDKKAFANNKTLKKLIIGKNINNIGANAFANSYIENVEFAKDSQITIIGETSFADMEFLKEIVLPDTIEIIDNGAFKGCSSLESIILPNAVRYIGKRAFKGCSSLEKIVIPENVTTIEDFTFKGCSSLKEVILTSNVTTIGNSAFAYCVVLEKIDISNVKFFGLDAFYRCDALK